MTKRYDILVRVCADLKAGERALIISDESTKEIGEVLFRAACEITSKVTHRVIPPLKIHGLEPPEDVAAQMLENEVIFGLTRMSIAHSQARFLASKAGARYLSLPDYSAAVLESPALLADFRALTGLSCRLADFLTDGKEVFTSTDLGTKLSCMINGRIGNPSPGWCWKAGTIASPPDAETNIALLEEGSSGVIIVDGSIPCPELGLLKAPLRLIIERGRIVRIEGQQADILSAILEHQVNPDARILGEFGIGLNPLAKLRGYMLEDEGCLGTAHIGIGSNATIGGKNNVAFHLDAVIRNVTVKIDKFTVIEDGKFREEIRNGCD